MRRVRIRWVLVSVVVLVVLVGAWVAWQAWQVNRDLNEAVDAVDDLRTAAEAGDAAGMDAALERLTDSSAAADDRTSGATWAALGHLPVLGDDVAGVEVVSSVVHDLAVDGARPLVEVSDSLDQLVPRDGGVDVDALGSLQAPVAAADSALARADRDLAAEDPTDYVMRLRDRYRDLAATVSDTHDALASASTALQVLPTMLGGNGSRNYLLVFQNNAEIRATGGLPGAVALVNATDGKLSLQRQVAGNTLNGPTPILPLTTAEKALYTDFLGRFFINANMTPDFPRTAELMRAWWASAYPDQVDGVLSIDPVAISFILDATGPVQVGDVELTRDNVVDELLHGVYLRYEDPADQDAFFQEVARTMFAKVIDGAGDPRGLLRALARGADQTRLYVHSFDADEQAVLAGTAVAGELMTDPTSGPQVTISFNDVTQSKMSYYLRYDVDVEATSCADGVQTYTGSAVVQSTAPDDIASQPDYITGGGFAGSAPGTQFVNMQIFAPAGGTLSDLRVNAEKISSKSIDFDGRPANFLDVQLDPGQKLRLSWRMTSGPDQAGATEVAVTPGIEDRDTSSVAASACRG